MVNNRQVRRDLRNAGRRNRRRAAANKRAAANNNTSTAPQRVVHNLYTPNERQCALDYGVSLLNPFDRSLAPCMPSLPAIENGALCVFADGSGTIGIDGYGGLVGFPTACNNQPSVWSTNALFNAARLPQASDVTAATADAYYNNSPHAMLDFGTSPLLQTRLVSMGIELWYTGTILNKSGEIFALQDPDHFTVAGLTFTEILNRKRSQRIDVGLMKKPCKVIYTPRQPEDYVFSPNFFGNQTNDGFMGILISGVPREKFGWRITSHFELVGVGVRHVRQVPAVSGLMDKVVTLANHAPASAATNLTAAQVKQAVSNVIDGQKARAKANPKKKGSTWAELGKDAMQIGAELLPLFTGA